jgi:ParB-like chromosome segregation protein Spo0J
MSMPDLKPERRTVKLADLKPWPGNANRGDVELVRASLRTHGQYRPLVVQKSRMMVIAGNTTMKAMLEEGREHVDVDLLDVTDAQAEKINLVDNRSRDLAAYDTQALAEQLASLNGDLGGTGFTAKDYDRIVDEAAKLAGEHADVLLDPEDGEGVDGYKEQYGVIVMCRDEEHQAAVYEQLSGAELDALDIKVVTT